MKQLMIRYTVRPDRAEENVRLISSVFESLDRSAPAGLRYSSYRLDDGVTFVHIVSMADPANNPLRALEAFHAFTAGIADRCEIPPVTTALHEVGHFAQA